ncbi:hypothetical protein LSH36_200g04082 [Paralvinella palmiformis]|uniref:Uncharacterized protein n=1 Tax=Paralvinella palmiformis TaxID=53620 RepID=A0AAD9JR21_9ANNE|nr:hypothetical protein LSH36_200g04082 [Paralvinella palmiformis]
MAPTDAETSDRASSRERSRAGSSSTAHEESLYAINPFNFDAKTSYEATESLLQTRAAAYERPEPPKDHDIWKLPPPDFRPQCYEPRPPPRNSREAIKPWKYGTIPGRRPQPITRHSAPLRLPSILQERQEEEGQFVTAFKIDGPWEAKLLYVKEGVFRPGRYQMPKPHDFRGYPSIETLGLPEFGTEYERDPYNLKFLSERLDILPGDGPARREERELKGPQMAPPMSAQLQWDRKLILDRDSFPNKYAAYTRHRRFDRSPHSALMERVEERLNASWAKRQLDRTIQSHRKVRNLDLLIPDQADDDPDWSDDGDETSTENV